jgi:hypothetical protein
MALRFSELVVVLGNATLRSPERFSLQARSHGERYRAVKMTNPGAPGHRRLMTLIDRPVCLGWDRECVRQPDGV